MCLKDARNVLNTFGWVRHTLGNETCGFCATGAIRYAANVVMGKTVSPREVLISEAMDLLYQKLHETHGMLSVVSWNDYCAASKDEVIAMFDAAIAASE